MSDTRTLVEKLEAMAASQANEHEAAVAAQKLTEFRAKSPPPPDPPTAVAAPAPDPWWWHQSVTWTSTTGDGSTNATGWINVEVRFG